MTPLNRKTVLPTIMFTILTLPVLCHAQNQMPSDSTIEIARAQMQADKATVIGTAMNFSEQDASAFWPIFRQYEHERSMLDDARVSVIKEYTEKYPKLTDAEAKDMAERMFEYDTRLAALRKTYFKKLNKVLPALTVTKFFQLDRRIDLLVDMQVESSLPPLTTAQFDEQAKRRVTATQEP